MATTVLQAGLSDAKKQDAAWAWWESSAYQLYLRTPQEELASVSYVLAATIILYSHYPIFTITVCFVYSYMQLDIIMFMIGSNVCHAYP